MEKIRGKYEQASEDQKAMYEQQLAEMEQRLKEAEEKNQRPFQWHSRQKAGMCTSFQTWVPLVMTFTK
jgi:U3 small nucleolar ribonucleoprotein component